MQINILKKSPFFRNLAIYMGGGAFAKVIGLISFLYIGKLLEPQKFAGLALFTMVVGILSIFVLFGLPSGMMRILWEDKRIVLTNSIFIVFVLGLMMALFVFFAGDLLLYYLSAIYAFLAGYKLLVSIRVLTMSCMAILNTYYIAIEKPAKFVAVGVVSSIIKLILIIVVANIQDRNQLLDMLWLIVLAQTAAEVIAVVFGLFITRKYILFSEVSIKKSIRLLKQTWVFFTKQIIGTLQVHGTTIILSVVATSYLLGVYTFYSNLLINLSFISGLFFKAYTPKIRNLLLSPDARLKKHALFLVTKSVKYYIQISIIFVPLIALALYAIFVWRSALQVFVQIDYLSNIELFYFMVVTWFIGNIRSFYDVWQYSQDKRVNKHILGIQIVILFFIYFSSLYFFKLFSLYGLVLNQAIIYIFVSIYSFVCYRKFVIKSVKDESNQNYKDIPVPNI
jgi:hypothetical protein